MSVLPIISSVIVVLCFVVSYRILTLTRINVGLEGLRNQTDRFKKTQVVLIFKKWPLLFMDVCLNHNLTSSINVFIISSIEHHITLS